MSEHFIKVFVEGKLEQKVLEALLRRGLVPAALQPSEATSDGKTNLLPSAAAHLRIGGRALVVRDWDELAPEALPAWLQGELARVFPEEKPAGRVVPVGAGLPDDADLHAAHALATFSMDDYILRLVRIRPVYEAIRDMRVPHDVVLGKLGEIAELLVANGLARPASKALLHHVVGITTNWLAPGRFATLSIEAAERVLGLDGLREKFEPLISDVEAAAKALE